MDIRRTVEYLASLASLAKRLVEVNYRLNKQMKPFEDRKLKIHKDKCKSWDKIPMCCGIKIEWIGERRK